MTIVRLHPNLSLLAVSAAGHFLEQAQAAIQSRGRFSVALSGGSTPRAAYELLASQTYATTLDWSRVHVFWGDERCVPPDHPDSNYRMAWETLLNRVPIPPENIHRMPGEAEPELAAKEYEQLMRSHYPSGENSQYVKLFDLILLGLGEDGHIASLFPGSPALGENVRWVVAVEHKQPPPPLVKRLTLTLTMLNKATQVTFLVAGAGKAHILKRVWSPPIEGQPPLPAQLVQPESGNLLWLVDEAAIRA